MDNKLLENIAKNIRNSLIKEGIFSEDYFNDDFDEEEEDEINPFEEYQNGYPNSDFKPNELTKRDLVKFCHSFGDFFIIVNNIFRGGMCLYTASTEDQQMSVIGDICKGNVTLTHEMDYLIESKLNFANDYVAVFKVEVQNDDTFYLVYEQSKTPYYNRYDETKKRNKPIKITRTDLTKMIDESIKKLIK